MLGLLQIKVNEITSFTRHDNHKDIWRPPELGTLKLNYDGTAKGNPGQVGFGGVFRNSKGEIIWIYEGNIGSTINNVVELHALENGITIVHNLKLSPLIVEGDSTLTNQIGKTLQQAINVEKVSNNWRLNKII